MCCLDRVRLRLRYESIRYSDYLCPVSYTHLDVYKRQILDHIPALTLPFDYTVFLTVLVLVWYILTELGSIVENAGRLGAPLPAWLSKAIAALESGVDSTGDKLTQGEKKE